MNQNSEDKKARFVIFGDMNVEAPLWLLIPKAFVSVLISAVLVLLVFRLYFDELTAFAYGFALFLSVLQILLIVGLRFVNRKDVHTTKTYQEDRFSKLGSWWIFACLFGAFFGWICGELAQSFPKFEIFFLSAKVFFTIIMPTVTMIPNIRYISRNAASIQIPLLFFVTFLPVSLGISSLLTIWRYFIG